MELAQVQTRSDEVLDEVEKAVVGKRESLELVLLGFLADGHVLLEDYPGLAKTLAARSFAQVLSMRLRAHPVHARSHAVGRDRLVDLESARRRLRVPAWSDLHEPPPLRRDQPRSAEDAGGAPRGDAGAPGDDRGDHASSSSRPFLVIATQNPIEYEGTYPLPEAQLDRFLLRTAFGYPDRDGEVDVLSRRIERESDDVELRAVVDRDTLLAMQGAVERVHVAHSVREYCVDLVAATRDLSEHGCGR